MSEDYMLMDMPGAFERVQHGRTRPDPVVRRVGSAQDNDRQQRPIPLGVVLTGYRLLTTIVIVGIGIPKAVYSYNGQSLVSPSLDWVGGMMFAVLLFWLGVIEATRPELCPRFFQVDLAPAILRIVRRDDSTHPGPSLPGLESESVSDHPTFPVPSIPERSSPTESRDPLSPVTQRAATRPVHLRPNAIPSRTYNTTTPLEEGPQPLTRNSNSGGATSSYGDSEDRHGRYTGRSREESHFAHDLAWRLSRPLPGLGSESVSDHPAYPVTSIPERSSRTEDPVSPVTQRATTMPVPVPPNATPYYLPQRPSIMAPQPQIRNSNPGWATNNYGGSEDRYGIFTGRGREETSASVTSSYQPQQRDDFAAFSDFRPRQPPRRPEMSRGRTSQAPPSFPCRFCGGPIPPYLMGQFGEFCSEGHKRQWETTFGRM